MFNTYIRALGTRETFVDKLHAIRDGRVVKK